MFASKLLRLSGAIAALGLILAAGLLARPASAAVVTFSSPVTISGNNDVSTLGSPVTAYNFGSAAQTLNGVTFNNLQGSTGGVASSIPLGSYLTFSNFTNDNVSAFGVGSPPFSNLSAAYQAMLEGGIYNGNSGSTGTVTLANLTAGHEYSVQIWVNDSRALTRAETVSTSGGNTQILSFDYGNTSGGVGQFTTGLFNGTGATISLTGTGTSTAQVAMIQVRDVSGVWSGSTNGAWDNTTPNFSGSQSWSTVSGVTNTVYFADTDGGGNAVTNSSISVQAGGVSTSNILFQNNAVNYSFASGDSIGITGSTAVTLQGTGSVTFNGPNTYSGATTIGGGTLQLGNSNALQNSTVNSGANNDLTFSAGLGSATFGGLIGGGNLPLQDKAGSPAAVNLTVGGNNSSGAYTGVLSGAGGLRKAGSGTLALSASQVYTGSTSINAGALLLNAGALSAASPVSVNSGTFGGNGSAGTVSVAAGGAIQGGYNGAGSLSLAALAFNGSGTVAISGVSAANSSSPAIAVGSGGLTTNGANSIAIAVGSLAGVSTGTYELIGYSAIGGSGTSAFQLAPLPSRAVGSLSFPSGLVDLNITGVDFLRWSGAHGVAWDTSTPNWNLNSTGGTATFINGTPTAGGDSVVFDNSAGVNTYVSLTTAIYPSAITVSSSNGYTFAGAGSIGGLTGLTMTGPGLLTISTSNSYSGGTTITGGTLQGTVAGALPGGGAVNVNGAAAVLDLDGLSSAVGAVNLTNGTIQNGTLSGSSFAVQNGLISATLGGAGALTKNTAGSVTLLGNNSYSGTTTINAGTLQIGNGGTTGSLASANIVNNGALVYNRSDSIDINVTSITGTGSISANAGTGTIGFRASSGTIQASSVTATSTFGSSSQTLYGSNYASAINLFVNNITTSGNQVYNGIVSIGRGVNSTVTLTTTGGGGVTLSGGVVSGVGNYWSACTLNIDTSAGNGPVSLGGAALAYGVGNLNISSGSGNTTLTGGDYAYDFSVFNSNVVLTGNTNFQYDDAGAQWVRGVTFNGSLSGAGMLTANFGSGAASTTGTGTSGLIFNTNTSSTIGSTIAGSAGLTKTGTGITIVTSANTYTGATTISTGTLQIGNGGSGAAAGSLSLSSVITTNDTLAFSRADTVTQGVDFSASAITGAGGLWQRGPGTLVLNAANNYSGPTTVNGGTLQLANAGSLNSAGTVSVSSGAGFGGNGSAGTVVVAPGGTIQNDYTGAGSLSLAELDFSGSGSITFGALPSYTASPAINISGALNTSGTNSITVNFAGNLVGTPTGTYQLIGYSSLGGSGTDAFQLGALPPRTNATLSYPAGLVDLNFISTDFLHWSGAASNLWNSTSVNWTLDSNGGTATFINGSPTFGGDTVVFDDGAGTNTAVSLSTALYPTSVTVSSSNNYTFFGSGSIGGAAALTMNGPGTLTISNTGNSYTGGTTISGGTLQYGVANALPTAGAVNVNGAAAVLDLGGFNSNAGALTLTNGTIQNGTVTASAYAFQNGLVSANLAGGAALSINTLGTVTLSGSNTFGGGTTLTAGQLNVNSASALGTGAFTIAGGVLDNTSGSPIALSTGIPQNWNGGFTFLGSNPLDLGSGAVTLNNSPTVNVAGGSLTVDGPANNGSQVMTVTGAGTLVFTNSLTLNNFNIAGGSVVFNGGSYTSTSGNGGTGLWLTSSPTASLLITNGATVNVYQGFQVQQGTATIDSGSVNVTSGGFAEIYLGNSSNQATLNISGGTVTGKVMSFAAGGSSATLNLVGGLLAWQGSPTYGNGSVAINLGGGTLQAQGTITVPSTLPFTLSGVNGNFTLDSNSNSVTFDNNLSGPGGLTKISSGTLNLAVPNSYFGGTIISNGVLQLGDNSALGDPSGSLTANGGTLDMNGFSPTVGDLTGAAGVITTSSGASTLTVGTSNSTAFSGTLVDGGGQVSLTYNGTGKLTLLGNSTNTGTTTVNGGTLALGNGGASGEILSPVALNNGGVLEFNRSDIVDFTAAIGGSGSLVQAGSGTLVLEGTNTYTGSTVVLDGTLLATNNEAIQDGTDLAVGSAAGLSLFGGVVPAEAGIPTAAPSAVAPVPEPGTLALLAAVLGSVAIYRRVRRK